MHSSHKGSLERRVILGTREYGIGSVLFRRVVGERLGVNDTDMECLGAIFFKGLATPSELAQYTGLSSGATTAMLDRLEKSGLIERHPNPYDRRSVHITIVKRAAKKIGPLFASLRAAQQEIVSSYSEDQLAILSDFFGRSAKMWKEERAKITDNRPR
ncbi:MAG TPA: MarR family transcriptional regulator [Candidatus Saccharimonadales bacterium]|nr:MarR family transcriptional regulator [Candidatus Saccharimonadales bacterium]